MKTCPLTETRNLQAAWQRCVCSAADPAGSGGCGRSPSAWSPSCPVSGPGNVPTFRFTWSLSALRSLGSDILCYSGETSERREEEEPRSAALPHPHDQHQMHRTISLGSGLGSDSGGLPSLGPPPSMQPRVRFAHRLPLALLSGPPSWAPRDYPRQGDPSRFQSVPADHSAHSYFTKSSAPSYPPPALSAADSSPPLVFATGVKAALSYFSLLRLSLLSGV